MATQQVASGQVPGSPDMGPVIESIRADVAEQFQISERLDTKARNLVAVVGAFFTIVQVIAKDALTASSTTAGEQITIAAFGVVAALLLVASIVATASAWRLLKEGLMPQQHFERIVDETYAGKTRGPRDLAKLYLTVLGARRRSNETRAARLKTATGLCLIAVLACLVEFIAAIVVQAT